MLINLFVILIVANVGIKEHVPLFTLCVILQRYKIQWVNYILVLGKGNVGVGGIVLGKR